MKDLNGRVVLLTGGGSGIGRLMCTGFAKEGARLVIWDIREDLMDDAAEAIHDEVPGSEVHTYLCDLGNRAMIYEVADRVKEEVGKVDVLVNNAGIVSGRSFLETTDEQNIKTMEINVMAHMWTLKAFLPAMIEENCGHIVTIASAAGTGGVCGLADYCASKFAAFGFDESIRMELKKQNITGVRCTCVCPYYIDTGMFDGAKTRFSWLFPILAPQYVASRIVGAVKRNQEWLAMPWTIYLVPLMRFLFPTWLFDWMSKFLGVSNSMDDFRGRGRNWALRSLEAGRATSGKELGK